MHDLDRTLNEFEAEFGQGEYAGEFGQGEYEYAGELYGELNEQEEEILAAELLGVSNEQELEQFLGSLFKKAVGAAKSVIRSPVGQALGGIVKDVAGKALPTVGGALGGMIGGDAGQQLGQQAGSWAKDKLGWEMEGGYEMELETAKALVRTATTAAKTVAATPPGAPPVAAARRAAIQAAQQHAPQLVRVIAGARPVPVGVTGPAGGVVIPRGNGRCAPAGRWVRQGPNIVLLNV